MVRQSIFRRQNRDDEETPLLTAEDREVARGDDSTQSLGRYRHVRQKINVAVLPAVDPVRDNIRNTVNRGRSARNATVIDVEDETTPLLGRGSVRDDNPLQSVVRARVWNRNPERSYISRVLSHAADKVQHYTAWINSAVVNLNEFTNNHIPRYRENDDSVMNGFRGIGAGISEVITGAVGIASVPVTLVGTGISEGLKAVSGVPRRERLIAGDGGGRFSDNTVTNLLGTTAIGLGGLVNAGKGVIDIADGTLGVIRPITKGFGDFALEGASTLEIAGDVDRAFNPNQTFSDNFENIGSGIKQLFASAPLAAMGAAAVVAGGTAKTLKFATSFGDSNTDFGVESGAKAVKHSAKIFGKGIFDIGSGIGGAIRSSYRAAPEATRNFASGFSNSFNAEERDKFLKRISGIPTNVNIEDGLLSRLGFGSANQAYSSMHDIKNAIVSLGNSRSNSKGGFSGSAYDVAGFIR